MTRPLHKHTVLRLYVTAATPPRSAHGFGFSDRVFMAKIVRFTRENSSTRSALDAAIGAGTYREEAIAQAVAADRERIQIGRRNRCEARASLDANTLDNGCSEP